MTVVFKRIPQSRVEAIKINRDLLAEAIIGWGDYVDEAGKEIPFSLDELKTLLDDTVFLRAATKAFFESLAGAQEGN